MTLRGHFLISILLLGGLRAHAQEAPPAFQPPRPPPIEPGADFDDMEDDLMEMGDDGFRPPPPPPPPGSASSAGTQTVQPTPGFDRSNMGGAPTGGGNFGGNSGQAKLKFKIVEGEYWEKGKKRSRGNRASKK
jgi:hypothetical protein